MESLRTNINQAVSDFRSIKNKLIEYGVEVADGTPTSEYANKIDDVYNAGGQTTDNSDEVLEAGKDEMNRAWWNALLTLPETATHAQRWNYRFFFVDFSPVGGFNPPYQLKPTTSSNMFYSASGIDFLSKDAIDFSASTNLTSLFERCKIKEIELIDSRSASHLNYIFNENSGTEKVGKLILKDDGSQSFNTASFFAAYVLKDITIEGVIGSNIWFTYCTKLTRDSMLGKLATTEQIAEGKNLFIVNDAIYYGGILGALKDYSSDTSGTTHTITLHATPKALLTDVEKAAVTQKGWTIA